MKPVAHCSQCSHPVMLPDLNPLFRTQMALANLIESIGLSDMMINGDASYELARPGWKSFLDDLYNYAAKKSFEVGEFGAAFDREGDLEMEDEE